MRGSSMKLAPNDRMHTAHGLLIASMALSVAACSKAESPETTVQAVVDAGAEPAAAPQDVVRTVEQRSPFGNLDLPDNLVLDGDFEFTGRTGQMPWLSFGDTGQGTLNFATGGLCRSGVRCASLGANDEIIGWMASPKTGGMEVSIWVKPPSGNCLDVSVAVTDLGREGQGAPLTPETSKVEPGRWCRFAGNAGQYAGKQPVLYVGTAGPRVTGPILVDDAVARTLPAALMRTMALQPRALEPRVAARVQFIGDWIRRHRIFGLPARESFEGPVKPLIDAPQATIR
jgi:hypothetical protein